MLRWRIEVGGIAAARRVRRRERSGEYQLALRSGHAICGPAVLLAFKEWPCPEAAFLIGRPHHMQVKLRDLMR